MVNYLYIIHIIHIGSSHPPNYPAVQTTHIPRAGVGNTFYPATGLTYDGSQQQASRQYVPGKVADQPDGKVADQSDPYTQPTPGSNQINPHNLQIGSLIQYGDPPCYGMIKWIGYPPGVNDLIAGIEMVSRYICA